MGRTVVDFTGRLSDLSEMLAELIEGDLPWTIKEI